MWSAVIGLLIAAPFYWLLIDTTSTPELIAGGVVAVIAAGAYGAAYLEPTENPVLRLRWLTLVIGEAAQVPKGIVIVCAEVLAQTVAPRKRRGAIETEPFATGEDRPHDMGRRALAESSRSLAPHTIVLGVDPDAGTLVQHRLGGGR